MGWSVSFLGRRRWLAVVLALLLTAQVPATAATITVSAGSGCTLVDAVTAANTDTPTGSCPAGSGADDIELTADVTLTTADNVNNGLPVVTTDITVNGNDFTIQRTGPEFRIFKVQTSGTLTLNDTTISNGSTDVGGGIYNLGTTHLANSNVSGNTANYNGQGGGIFNEGTLTLTNSTVSGNTASGTAYGLGGGIANGGGTVTLTNSTVSGNAAVSDYGYGGGIYNALGILNLTNSTVSGNTVSSGSSDSAGIWNFSGGVTLTNSTVAGNMGGGIYDYGSGTTTLTSSIVDANTNGNCTGAAGGFVDGGNNYDDDGSCPAAQESPASLIDATLDDNGGPTQTHALLAGSAAIDAVACTLLTDQRGFLRSDGLCDSGAFEFGAGPMEVPALPRRGLILLASLFALGLLVALLFRRRRVGAGD